MNDQVVEDVEAERARFEAGVRFQVWELYPHLEALFERIKASSDALEAEKGRATDAGDLLAHRELNGRQCVNQAIGMAIDLIQHLATKHEPPGFALSWWVSSLEMAKATHDTLLAVSAALSGMNGPARQAQRGPSMPAPKPGEVGH